jgi:hypothetical protein
MTISCQSTNSRSIKLKAIIIRDLSN